MKQYDRAKLLRARIFLAIETKRPLVLSVAELRLINVRVIEPYTTKFVDCDSPKGEYTPGVRYKMEVKDD